MVRTISKKQKTQDTSLSEPSRPVKDSGNGSDLGGLYNQIAELVDQAETPFDPPLGQILAQLLSFLQVTTGFEIISVLSDELQTEIAFNLVAMNCADQETGMQVVDSLRQQLPKASTFDNCQSTSEQLLARMLENTDSATSETFIEIIGDYDVNLASQLTKLRFTFDDLESLADRPLQRVLRMINTEDLALALSDANESLKRRIFANQSARARRLLQNDLDAIGNCELHFVEAARRRIGRALRQLEAEEDESTPITSLEYGNGNTSNETSGATNASVKESSRSQKKSSGSSKSLRPARALAD